jgi:hypothetical protein
LEEREGFPWVKSKTRPHKRKVREKEAGIEEEDMA